MQPLWPDAALFDLFTWKRVTIDFQKYVDCIRLNCRAGHLALRNQWLGSEHFEESYDRLAADYNEAWLRHLRPVTERLLDRLPDNVSGRIVELGCGTGFVTRHLVERYPKTEVVAVDLSANMLEQTRKILDGRMATLFHEDMLSFLLKQPDHSAAMIVSAWAIGYSYPDRILREVSRVLNPAGVFAFVVNCADTLRPVYIAFRKTMARYPQFLKYLAWPRFPEGWNDMERMAKKARLHFVWRDDGQQRIIGPETKDRILPWLLKTGILAGFDHMLPLDTPGPVRDYFEQVMRESEEPIHHHFIAAVVQRT